MKIKNFYYLTLSFMVALGFSSCEKNEEDNVSEGPTSGQAYISNYGSFSGSKSTVTMYDFMNNAVYQGVYERANDVAINSNVQHMAINDGKMYLASNDGDKIDVVDATTMKAIGNPVSEKIAKPRYIAFKDNKAYISCWGQSPDWDIMPNSYIAVMDMSSNTVTDTIPMAGGPEGLAVVGNKLYVALNYKYKIGVVDLSSNNYNTSYINSDAVTSYFLKEDNNNLYVSMVSTYSDPANSEGLGYINTSLDSITEIYNLTGIATSYSSMMAFNNDESKIYVIASTYNEEWELVGGVKIFDIASKEFESTPLVSDAAGINAVGVNPVTGEILCMYNPGTTNGTMEVREEDGSLLNTFETGISPNRIVFFQY